MICLPSNFPLASCNRIHFATSLTEELTPPVGDCASGSRLNFCTHFPSTSTCPSALFWRAMKSPSRGLVEVMECGLYSFCAHASSHYSWDGLTAARAHSVMPKFAYASGESKRLSDHSSFMRCII